VLARVDGELERLVSGMADDRTLFVIAGDHGHIGRGGHGGPEPEVVRAPAILVGPGIALGSVTGRQVDLAPTVALASGLPVPRHSLGRALTGVLVEPSREARTAAHRQRERAVARYIATIEGGEPSVLPIADFSDDQLDSRMAVAETSRLARERSERLPRALLLVAAAAMVAVAIGLTSWRALIAATAGLVAYNAVFLGAYFARGWSWSLSVLNTEEMVESFFLARMAEAALAGLLAAAVAAAVYPLLRGEPKGPRGAFLGGWLALGPATVLLVQALLGVQVAVFLWAWGADVTWFLPDLAAGFKYDVDLVQTVGLGAAAVLSPLVTYLVGRYHPGVGRGRTASPEA
jgi:hypothetical protein